MNNITVFAPSNKAFESLPREVLINSTRLRDILLYHIAIPETRACDFTNEQLLKTRLNNRSVRMNLYSMFPSPLLVSEVTAQCGVLKNVNQPSCNGLIHSVDRVLIPSEMSLLETLKTQNDFTIFTRLLQESELVDTIEGEVSYTIFVPTDAAFYKLPRDKLTKILTDKQESAKILKLYIVKDTICCGGISPNIWFMTKLASALNGRHVPIYRDTKGQVNFGSAKVSVCDLTASNGVVHAIDELIDSANLNNPNEYMQTCVTNDFSF
jgi:uncharacterized surface protein with fasciclin (FAS1) repeats